MREPESWHAHANSRDTHTDTSLHVGQGGSGSRAEVHDHGNKALAIVALVAACVALGMVTMYVILAAQLIDAKIAAGTAQAEATAREARTTAKVTEDKLYELRDALNSKGMNLPKLDGH